jgi:hypothetical protein
MSDVKEVMMDVTSEQSGGGTRRRRRGGGGRRRRTAHAQEGGAEDAGAAVVKMDAAPAAAPVAAPTLAIKELAPVQAGGGAKAAAVVILSPPKKKPVKVMLVPKGKPGGMKAIVRKTFKAKRVHVTIDNTAKTVKHRRQVLGRVDAMTDDQVRAAAVAARLTSRERVTKAPIALLRQMVRDYQTMKGMLL